MPIEQEKNFVSGYTVCANDRNWSRRFVRSYGLLLILSGTCKISIDMETIDVNTGNLILMHPAFRHSFHTSNVEMLWFHFVPRPHVMSLLDWPEKIKGLASIQLEGAVFESAQRELQEAHLLEKHHLKGWFPLACSLLETTLIRGCYHLLNQESKNIKSILNIQKLLQESRINIDEIAKRCGVSRASLYKKFKDATGISPQQYRESLALQEAMHLLESTTMPIAQVAEEAGFSDPFYFSTRFRKYYGISPRKHRGNRDSNISKPPAAFGVNKNSKNL